MLFLEAVVISNVRCDSENSASESEDFEAFHVENKKHRPYRDAKEPKENPPNTTLVKFKVQTQEDIKEKVKKTILSKTQKDCHRRRVKKGESSVSTKIQQENRFVIKDSLDGW